MFSPKAAPGFTRPTAGGFFSASSFEGTEQNPVASDITRRLQTSANDSCKVVSVLYARNNSIYKKFPSCDVFDLARDARTYNGRLPVIAHPPCRLWGRLYKQSTAPQSERALALHAVHVVRNNGGVLEHPAWSKLWPAAGLPAPGERDEFGGFTLPILQSWFGHKAPKATWLYIVGIEPAHLPAYPFVLGIPAGRICASHSMKLREGTPEELAHWLYSVAYRCVPQPMRNRQGVGNSGHLPKSQNVFKRFEVVQKSLFDQAEAVFPVSGEFDFGRYGTSNTVQFSK